MPRKLLRVALLLSVGAWICSPELATSAEGEDGPDGQVRGDPSKVQITVKGDYRYIFSNGLPDHPRGAFPNRGNPNQVQAQPYRFRLPLQPAPSARATRLGHFPFGVALNGVPFDPGAAEWWRNDRRSGWQIEPLSGAVNLGLDAHLAHVQPNGAYHYHGLGQALLARRRPDAMTQVGWAADGYPIYLPWAPRAGSTEGGGSVARGLREVRPSYRLKAGTRAGGEEGPGGRFDGTYVQDYEFAPGSGDLDEHNGQVCVTPEFPAGTYCYFLTDAFPFVPRSFRGTPDPSFQQRGGAGRGGRGPGMGPGGRGPGVGPGGRGPGGRGPGGRRGPPPWGPPPRPR